MNPPMRLLGLTSKGPCGAVQKPQGRQAREHGEVENRSCPVEPLKVAAIRGMAKPRPSTKPCLTWNAT
ncbi:hypothetical protein NDU88_001608 [Pleurodeles waltl]|uniref:Uncharacterized protein n=1 Tax=Pleurodeles waltl TaxID=8319 RepID=A0AAV7WIU2_PLEWA|nr:hypothetical protein NDU88_001608 [Pleurodeles waltl]